MAHPVVSRYLANYYSMLADPCRHVCSRLFVRGAHSHYRVAARPWPTNVEAMAKNRITKPPGHFLFIAKCSWTNAMQRSMCCVYLGIMVFLIGDSTYKLYRSEVNYLNQQQLEFGPPVLSVIYFLLDFF